MNRPSDGDPREPAGPALRASLESQPDLALIEVNADRIVRGWSDGARLLLGLTAEEAIGRDVRGLFHEESRTELGRRLTGAADAVPGEWRVDLLGAEGAIPCAVRILAGPASGEAGAGGALLLVRDRRIDEASSRSLRLYRRLSAMLDGATLLLDAGGRILELGAAWSPDRSEGPRSWPGRHVADLVGADRRVVLTALREAAREGRWTGRWACPGGAVHLTLARVQGPDGSLEAFLAVRRPEVTEANSGSLLARIPGGVLLLDRELRVREANEEAVAILGGPPGVSPVGLDVRSLAAFQVREIQAALDGLREGRPCDLPAVPLVATDGSPVAVRLKGAALADGDEGTEAGVVLFLLPSTGATDVERQLMRAQKMESIGNFASGLAHDFGNFVAVILGKAGVLRVKLPDDRHITRDLDDIETAAKRAQHLAQELMKFARGGRHRIHRLEVNRLIEEVGSLIQTSVGKRITIDLRLGNDLPPVDGDEVELQQLVLNLCLNARDAMPHGGHLTIETRRLGDEQRARLAGSVTDGISLVVRDTGAGMPPEVLERIFEPFFTTKHDGNKGAGLGLAMVYGIVRRHGGVIDVKSRPGIGTAFEMLLPGASASSAAAAAGTYALVVDDDPAFAEMVRLILEEEGHRVKLASNGIEALRTIREELGSLSLVILDLRMPGVDGLGVLEELRELAPSLPVLVTTGDAGPEEKTHALARGARQVLEKPYRVAELKQALDAILPAEARERSSPAVSPRSPSGEIRSPQ